MGITEVGAAQRVVIVSGFAFFAGLVIALGQCHGYFYCCLCSGGFLLRHDGRGSEQGGEQEQRKMTHGGNPYSCYRWM